MRPETKKGRRCFLSPYQDSGCRLALSANRSTALRAALISRSCGIVSNVSPSTSTVRQSESPQTELHRLAPTSACTSSSNGFPAIQIRLDSDGCALKNSSLISLISRVGVMPRGRRIFLSWRTACLISCCVSPHRRQVSPFLTSRCQTIGNVVIFGSPPPKTTPAAGPMRSVC